MLKTTEYFIQDQWDRWRAERVTWKVTKWKYTLIDTELGLVLTPFCTKFAPSSQFDIE